MTNKKVHRRLENKLSSSASAPPPRPNFYEFSESSASHLSSFDSIFFRANQCRPNEQGFNEERMSIKRGSLQLLIHHIFSCINCAGSSISALRKNERRDQVFRKEIISILHIPGEPLLDAISIIWPYSCRERVENDERKFSLNMSH